MADTPSLPHPSGQSMMSMEKKPPGLAPTVRLIFEGFDRDIFELHDHFRARLRGGPGALPITWPGNAFPRSRLNSRRLSLSSLTTALGRIP